MKNKEIVQVVIFAVSAPAAGALVASLAEDLLDAVAILGLAAAVFYSGFGLLSSLKRMNDEPASDEKEKKVSTGALSGASTGRADEAEGKIIKSKTFSSRNINKTVNSYLTVLRANDKEADERLKRQLLFMARSEGWPEKQMKDIEEFSAGDSKVWRIPISSSGAGLDYNQEIYGPQKYVEDFVE